MTFDAEFAIAKADAALIMIEHYLRQADNAKSSTTARLLYTKIEAVAVQARRTAKRLERGDNWQYYCRCGFAEKPNVEVRGPLMCPRCGEGLGCRNLDCKNP